MPIISEAGFEISDENSVTPPRPVNRKRKRMSKGRGASGDKWTEDEESTLVSVLYEDAKSHGFNSSTMSASRWTEIRNELARQVGKDKFNEEQIKSKYQRLRRETKTFKDLLNSCSGYGWNSKTNTVSCDPEIWKEHVKQKKEKGIYISKFRFCGPKDFNTLNEIFANSFSTGDNVMYSTNPNYSRQSNEAAATETEPFDCDDYTDGIENVYRPMSVNIGSGTGSGKRAAECDISMQTEGGTSTRRKKGRAIIANDSPDYFKEYFKLKLESKEAKQRKKQEKELAEAEIDIYSEAAVTTYLQNILEKHGLADRNFSLAVPHLLNPSFRKIFMHMTEKNQVEWFCTLGPN